MNETRINRIKESQVKKAFKTCLESLNFQHVKKDSDGVDAIAFTRENKKLYFELKTCGKTEKNLKIETDDENYSHRTHGMNLKYPITRDALLSYGLVS